MDRAFQEAKTHLANATLLAHFMPDTELALTTDASDFAVGAVLEQKVAGSWRPLAFYSFPLQALSGRSEPAHAAGRCAAQRDRA